ncbi:adhesive plaque matrix protein-like isoform X1 [Portunus trituberculatus]|uniref:adhesive plaque matrix protein-like isoform X1 n=1 Tax=Portunus trituberculatus TaxID=210409 RepID=UPI001E1CB33C|nr:adhesive plaque matrix protein-like isoform X1 [Portunus trituberculatus]
MSDTRGRDANLYNAHGIHTQTITPTQHTRNVANTPPPPQTVYSPPPTSTVRTPPLYLNTRNFSSPPMSTVRTPPLYLNTRNFSSPPMSTVRTSPRYPNTRNISPLPTSTVRTPPLYPNTRNISPLPTSTVRTPPLYPNTWNISSPPMSTVRTPQLYLNPHNPIKKQHKSTQIPENLKYKRQKSTQTTKRKPEKNAKATQIPQNCFQLQKSTQTSEQTNQKLSATCTTHQMQKQTQVTQTSKNLQELEKLLRNQADPRTSVKHEKEKPNFKIPEVSEETLIKHLGTIPDLSKKAEAREKDKSLKNAQKPLRDKTQEHTQKTAHSSKHSTSSANEPDPSEDAAQVMGFVRPRLLEQRAEYPQEECHPLKNLAHCMKTQTPNRTQPVEQSPKLLKIIIYLIRCTKLTFRRQHPIPHRPKPLHPWQNATHTTLPNQKTSKQARPMRKKPEEDKPIREPQAPIVVKKGRVSLHMDDIYGENEAETCSKDEDMMDLLMPTPSREVKGIVTLNMMRNECKGNVRNESRSEHKANMDKHEEKLTGETPSADEAMMAFLMPTASREVKDTVTLNAMGNNECKGTVRNEIQPEHKRNNLVRHEENRTGAVMRKQCESKKKKKLKEILKPMEKIEPKEANLIEPKEIYMRKEPEPMKESIKLKEILKKPKEKKQNLRI